MPSLPKLQEPLSLGTPVTHHEEKRVKKVDSAQILGTSAQ